MLGLRKISIDPTKLTDESEIALKQLFNSSSLNMLFEGDQTVVEIDLPENEGKCNAHFSRITFFRPSTKILNKFHCETFNLTPVSLSPRSAVLTNTGTLKKNQNTLSYKKRVGEVNHDMKRIAKLIYLTDTITENKIKHEYEISKHVEYLGMKPPVFLKRSNGKQIACLMMNRLPGKTLFDFITNDLISLNTIGRIDLSIGLLQALNQLHQKDIVHKDLKPENIHVVMHHGKFSIYLFDFDLSKFAHQSDIGMPACGTPAYMSPEVLNKLGSTKKSDIHSISQVIGLLFGALQRDETQHLDKMLNIIHQYSFEKIFLDNNDLDDKQRDVLRNTLLAMYNEEHPQDRLSIDEAILVLKQVKCELSSKQTHDLSESHQINSMK